MNVERLVWCRAKWGLFPVFVINYYVDIIPIKAFLCPLNVVFEWYIIRSATRGDPFTTRLLCSFITI